MGACSLSCLAGRQSNPSPPPCRSDYCPQCLNAGGPYPVSGNGMLTWPNGQHGICGDPYDSERKHESYGEYGGINVAGVLPSFTDNVFDEGSVIKVSVTITAFHKVRVRGGGGSKLLAGASRGMAIGHERECRMWHGLGPAVFHCVGVASSYRRRETPTAGTVGGNPVAPIGGTACPPLSCCPIPLQAQGQFEFRICRISAPNATGTSWPDAEHSQLTDECLYQHQLVGGWEVGCGPGAGPAVLTTSLQGGRVVGRACAAGAGGRVAWGHAGKGVGEGRQEGRLAALAPWGGAARGPSWASAISCPTWPACP